MFLLEGLEPFLMLVFLLSVRGFAEGSVLKGLLLRSVETLVS